MCVHCAVWCDIVLQCVAVCCSVLQCVAVCCSVLQCVAGYSVWSSKHETLQRKQVQGLSSDSTRTRDLETGSILKLQKIERYFMYIHVYVILICICVH